MGLVVWGLGSERLREGGRERLGGRLVKGSGDWKLGECVEGGVS